VAKDYLKETRDGFEKWFRLVCYIALLWWFLDFLPRLPAEIGKRFVDALLSKLGV
jgi:hypothetical protein